MYYIKLKTLFSPTMRSRVFFNSQFFFRVELHLLSSYLVYCQLFDSLISSSSVFLFFFFHNGNVKEVKIMFSRHTWYVIVCEYVREFLCVRVWLSRLFILNMIMVRYKSSHKTSWRQWVLLPAAVTDNKTTVILGWNFSLYLTFWQSLKAITILNSFAANKRKTFAKKKAKRKKS